MPACARPGAWSPGRGRRRAHTKPLAGLGPARYAQPARAAQLTPLMVCTMALPALRLYW